MENEFDTTGLDDTPERDWPKAPTAAQVARPPIDILKPGSREHDRVKEYLTSRLRFSEERMSDFYDRWRANEKRKQAYLDLNTYEQALKDDNDDAKSPAPVKIVVPYMFSTISTIVTYLVHTFTGRKPIFQVASNKREAIDPARNMETKLQYDSDHTRMVKRLYQMFQDGEDYGLGIIRIAWNKQQERRTIWTQQRQELFLGIPKPGSSQRVRSSEIRTVFEGNDAMSVDPFMFFPDPRVPMAEVSRKGEFVFWREFAGKHELKALEAAGKIKYVDATTHKVPTSRYWSNLDNSDRNIRSGGEGTPGAQTSSTTFSGQQFYQVDQGTCWIIPKELGLGDSTSPEHWIFTILNKSQIVQAEPFDADHNRHPVAVIEPYTSGYGFGNLGMTDYTAPMQDIMSWLVNSHMENVRTAINNMFLVDPSRIEMQDLERPGPGKIIRMKNAAYGQDVRTMFHQLAVTDATQGHFASLEIINRIADNVSSVNDNLRGLQENSGRKSATEVRTSAEAGASRLASHAKLISAQGIVDIAEMMSLNNQQYLSEEFMLQVVGEDGKETPITIAPEHLVGDFYYPIHDGTLPIDRVAMVDVWKEILLATAQDPELRQRFNLIEMFKYIAELGGAKNIERFEIQQSQDPAALAQQAQQGNVVPLEQTGDLGGAPTPGVEANPGERLQL